MKWLSLLNRLFFLFNRFLFLATVFAYALALFIETSTYHAAIAWLLYVTYGLFILGIFGCLLEYLSEKDKDAQALLIYQVLGIAVLLIYTSLLTFF